MFHMSWGIKYWLRSISAERSMFLKYRCGDYAAQVPETGNEPSGNGGLKRISLSSFTKIRKLSVSKNSSFCIIAMPMYFKLD